MEHTAYVIDESLSFCTGFLSVFFVFYFLFFSSLCINDDDFRFSVIVHIKYFILVRFIICYSIFSNIHRWLLWFFSSPFDIWLAIVDLYNFSSFCFSFLLMDPMIVRDFVICEWFNVFIYLNSEIQFSFLFVSRPDPSIIRRSSEVKSGISILMELIYWY